MSVRRNMCGALQSVWLLAGLCSAEAQAQSAESASATGGAPVMAAPSSPGTSPGRPAMTAAGMGGGAGALPPMTAGNPMAQGQPPDELRDILPPVDLPFWTLRRKLYATGAGAVLAALAGYGVGQWRRRVVPPPPPPDPAWVALSALRKLEGAEGEVLSARDFAAAVAGVLRAFLEARHGIAAPRQTTEEFLEGVTRSNRFLLPVREQLRLFLRGCDELKFAGVHTTGKARTELVSAAARMIEEGLA